ncbi:MAG TPA: hypothetical protein PLP23_18835 [Panacibacter sp.]|nr:hypothetical protein [Panacibacter sp.]
MQPLRVDAHPRYKGEGVTICFIDSGFYPHPGLTATTNRIRLMHDITTAKDVDIHIVKTNHSPFIDYENKSITFYFYDDCADQVSVAGSFNQ